MKTYINLGEGPLIIKEEETNEKELEKDFLEALEKFEATKDVDDQWEACKAFQKYFNSCTDGMPIEVFEGYTKRLSGEEQKEQTKEEKAIQAVEKFESTKDAKDGMAAIMAVRKFDDTTHGKRFSEILELLKRIRTAGSGINKKMISLLFKEVNKAFDKVEKDRSYYWSAIALHHYFQVLYMTHGATPEQWSYLNKRRDSFTK